MAGEHSTATAPAPVSLLTSGAATGVWELDPTASKFEFRVKHFWGAVTVRGHFGTIAGQLHVDASGAMTGNVEAQSASLDTGMAQRDKHLRSADFFDVANHPTVLFTVARVAGLDDDRLEVSGDLEAAGHTVPITFETRVSDAIADRVTIDGEVSVNRREAFGMRWSPLGMASATALLSMHAVFVKAPSAAG